MNFKFLAAYKRLSSKKTLESLDYLYKSCVSKLPISYRINYCTSLIYRIKEDIENCKCKLKKGKLKKQLIVTISELKKLNNL